MSPRPPTFTAIIPNYNHAQFIVGALDAALNQTVPFDEILVIDDASTDNSVALIEARLAGVANARLIRNPQNLGVVETTNLGIREATGDFVYLMAADDLHHPQIVEWNHAALARYPDVGMISGNTCIWDPISGNARTFTLPFPQEYGRYTYEAIEPIAQRRAFTFLIGANVMRRDLLIAMGLQLPSLKWHCDWIIYLLLAHRAPFAVIPHELVRIREADTQFSHACFHWKTQRPVIKACVTDLKRHYPEDYDFFRSCALLPTYDVQTLWLAIVNREVRAFLTPLLVWRLLTYKLFRRLARLCPSSAKAQLRRWLRV